MKFKYGVAFGVSEVDLQSKLNVAGANGWRLHSVIGPLATAGLYNLIFERPMPEKKPKKSAPEKPRVVDNNPNDTRHVL